MSGRSRKEENSRAWEASVSKILREKDLLEKHYRSLSAISGCSSSSKGATAAAAASSSSKSPSYFASVSQRVTPFLQCHSSLSPRLSDVLKHDTVLPYLIQYLQEKGQAQLVYFWLAAETFRLSDTSSLNAKDSSSCAKESNGEIPQPDDDELLDVDESGIGNPFATDLITSDNPEKEVDEGEFGSFCLSGDVKSIRISLMPEPITVENGDSLSDNDNFFKQNAVNIFMRYICKDSAQNVQLPEHLGTEVWSEINSENGVRSSCFVNAQSYVYSVITNEHFEGFLSSHHFVSYQLDRITCRNVSLIDVIFCHNSVSHLMEFLQLFSLHNLLACFLALQNFKLNYDVACSLKDASTIFNNFFSPHSPNRVHFPEIVVSHVESVLLQTTKQNLRNSVDPDSEDTGGENVVGMPCNVFDTTLLILGNALKTDVFPYFLKSRFYRQLKRELEVCYFSMQQSKKPDRGVKDGGVETECEQLLEEKPKGLPSYYNFYAENNLNAHRSVEAPPTKREVQTAHRQLGVVNAIGEYVSHSQYQSLYGDNPAPQQPQTVGSKLKKLLRGKKDPEEEDMEAWLAAQKIVNEVKREAFGL